MLFKPATKFQITKRYAWDSTNPRKDQENGTIKESWDPALDNEAVRYLDADLKDTILQMIVFKKEL